MLLYDVLHPLRHVRHLAGLAVLAAVGLLALVLVADDAVLVVGVVDVARHLAMARDALYLWVAGELLLERLAVVDGRLFTRL